MKKNRGKFLSFLAGILVCILGFNVLFYVNYGSLPFVSDGVFSPAVISKMNTIQDLIDEDFLTETDPDTVEEGIYAGMLESLDDTYSVYYTSEEYKRMYEETSGTYRGLGMVMRLDEETGEIVVTQCFEGAPADLAGIEPGDVLLKIDDTELTGMELEEVSSMIRDGEDPEIVLTISRDGEIMEITAEPGEVEVPVVDSRTVEDNYGYIQISEFTDGTSDQFEEAYQELLEQDIEGLIIDLRGNPGGYLTAVIATLRQILPEGLITYTETRDGEREEYSCDGDTPIEIPLVVLVNGDSASASEIFAGAVKDHEVGTLVGTTTFGKGIVQRIYPLSDGSAVKLTVSKYYTPNGINIHGSGIDPDVKVEWTGEEEFYSPSQFNDLEEEEWLEEDNQMKEALEILKND